MVTQSSSKPLQVNAGLDSVFIFRALVSRGFVQDSSLGARGEHLYYTYTSHIGITFTPKRTHIHTHVYTHSHFVPTRMGISCSLPVIYRLYTIKPRESIIQVNEIERERRNKNEESIRMERKKEKKEIEFVCEKS